MNASEDRKAKTFLKTENKQLISDDNDTIFNSKTATTTTLAVY